MAVTVAVTGGLMRLASVDVGWPVKKRSGVGVGSTRAAGAVVGTTSATRVAGMTVSVGVGAGGGAVQETSQKPITARSRAYLVAMIALYGGTHDPTVIPLPVCWPT